MRVSAALANTRVNPVFQLLFRLLRLHSVPSRRLGLLPTRRTPSTASFLALSTVLDPPPSTPRGARACAPTNRQKEAPVHRGRVTFMLAELSSSLFPSLLLPRSSQRGSVALLDLGQCRMTT